MNKTSLLSIGSSWLALLVGLFAWLSPDSPYFPEPTLALGLVGIGLLFLLAWVIAAGVNPEGERQPVPHHLGAIAPLYAAALALFLASRHLLPQHPSLPLIVIVILGVGAQRLTQKLGGEPMGAVGEFVVALFMIAPLFIVLPALGVATVGQKIWQVTDTDLSRAEGRIRATDALNRYRPAPVIGYSADGAGISMWVIAATGTPGQDLRLIPIEGAGNKPWIPDTGLFSTWRADSVMRYALHGLTGPERLWLQNVASHPGRSLLDSVAYAGEMDPWAALKLPLPADIDLNGLPTPRVIALRNAARARLMAAVLAASSNQHAVADSLIQSVIGFGLRLRDDSDLLVVALVGATIAREAGLTMAEHWRGEGNFVMADSLTLALSMGEKAPGDTFTTPPRAASEIRQSLIDSARMGKQGRAMRWEDLSLLGLASCTDLRELLYGPTWAIRTSYAAAAPTFQHSPQWRAVFDVQMKGISGVVEPRAVPVLLRPAAWVLGERAGRCAGVVM